MLNGVQDKLFSPTRKQRNNKESLATVLFEQLNFEQSFLKTVFKELLAKLHKNHLCKVSRRRARDRDLNPSWPRPRLQRMGLESRLRQTETNTTDRDRSRDSITNNHVLD